MDRRLTPQNQREILIIACVYGGVILVVGLTMYVLGARRYTGLAMVPFVFFPEMYRWSSAGVEPLARSIAILNRALSLIGLTACVLVNL